MKPHFFIVSNLVSRITDQEEQSIAGTTNHTTIIVTQSIVWILRMYDPTVFQYMTNRKAYETIMITPCRDY